MKVRALLCLASIVAVGAIGTVSAGASNPIEYFTASQTSFDGQQTVVASGPISATGYDTQVTGHKDFFVFPDGQLTVHHEPLTRKQSFDSRTCVQTFTETGTYSIVHGSGAYAHVTGSGVYKVSGIFQGCDQSQPPTSASVVIQAHGPITL